MKVFKIITTIRNTSKTCTSYMLPISEGNDPFLPVTQTKTLMFVNGAVTSTLWDLYEWFQHTHGSTQGGAYEIKGFIILIGPGEGGIVPHSGGHRN